MRDAGLAAGVGFLFSGAGDAGFLYQQPAHGAQRRRSSGGVSPPRRHADDARAAGAAASAMPTAACWMTGCAGEPLRYRLGLYPGGLIPFVRSRYQ